eukprot:1196358-Prorocentrum_minimum.AAC.1
MLTSSTDEEEEWSEEEVAHGNLEDPAKEECDGRLDEYEEDFDDEIDFVDEGDGQVRFEMECDQRTEGRFCSTGKQTAEDNKFDQIIGALEDLLISPEFEEMQSSFCLENWCVTPHLSCKRVPRNKPPSPSPSASLQQCLQVEGFSMLQFAEMLEAKKDTLDVRTIIIPPPISSPPRPCVPPQTACSVSISIGADPPLSVTIPTRQPLGHGALLVGLDTASL